MPLKLASTYIYRTKLFRDITYLNFTANYLKCVAVGYICRYRYVLNDSFVLEKSRHIVKDCKNADENYAYAGSLQGEYPAGSQGKTYCYVSKMNCLFVVTETLIICIKKILYIYFNLHFLILYTFQRSPSS